MPALSEKPVVGAGGGVYVSPFGTAAPDTFADLDTDPWRYTGLISEDGVAYTPPEEETEDMNVWQLQFPWDVVVTGMSSSFGFQLAQWDQENLTFAFGGGSWEAAGALHTQFEPLDVGEAAPEYALCLKVLTSSGNSIGITFPRCKVTAREEITFAKGEMSTLGVTVTMLGQDDVKPYYILGTLAGLPVPA